VGECFFRYRLAQVIPDKGPINGYVFPAEPFEFEALRVFSRPEARFTKYLTIILRLFYDNTKVMIQKIEENKRADGRVRIHYAAR